MGVLFLEKLCVGALYQLVLICLFLFDPNKKSFVTRNCLKRPAWVLYSDFM